MSSKIVGWLVGDWDGKKSDFKKNLNKKKLSELNLKRRNPVFLPLGEMIEYWREREGDICLKIGGRGRGIC